MAVYKRGGKWWYKFNWNGRPIRESTKAPRKNYFTFDGLIV